jgi:hypothetical protein
MIEKHNLQNYNLKVIMDKKKEEDLFEINKFFVYA